MESPEDIIFALEEAADAALAAGPELFSQEQFTWDDLITFRDKFARLEDYASLMLAGSTQEEWDRGR